MTLLQRAGQLLPREDADVAAAVAEVISDQGVDVRPGANATAVRREPGSGAVAVTLADGTEIRANDLLVCTGRTPVTADLDLEKADDVAGSPQFTHASWNDYRIIRANLTGGDAVTTGRLVPYTVFTTRNWPASG